MLDRVRGHNVIQLMLGLLFGILFGFLLQKGGLTHYNVLIGQLLLTDFTVIKVILTAIVTGMVGVYTLRWLGWVELKTKPGSIGSSVVGGLLFGVGFGLLGYCPGTVTGAAGQGFLDALAGGIPGMLLGAGLYAAVFPKVRDNVLDRGAFGDVTLPEAVSLPAPVVVGFVCLLIIASLTVIERIGY